MPSFYISSAGRFEDSCTFLALASARRTASTAGAGLGKAPFLQGCLGWTVR